MEILAPETGGDRRRVAYFDFLPVPQNIAGYVWDFPTQVKGEPMRCWGIYDTNLLSAGRRPQLKEPLAREMSRIGFNLEEYEIKGHPICWFSPENPMSALRVLFVGDAAGADPLFGEGISIALGYGALAAREIGEAMQLNEFSFTGYKNRVLSKPAGTVVDLALDAQPYRLFLEVEMVPDPFVEDYETDCNSYCLAVCTELGKTIIVL